MIAMFRIMMGTERIDNKGLFLWDTGNTRGHGKKLRKTRCLKDVKKYSFPFRSIELWNSLDEEIIQSKSIHEFKAKIDHRRYGDGTPRV